MPKCQVRPVGLQLCEGYYGKSQNGLSLLRSCRLMQLQGDPGQALLAHGGAAEESSLQHRLDQTYLYPPRGTPVRPV